MLFPFLYQPGKWATLLSAFAMVCLGGCGNEPTIQEQSVLKSETLLIRHNETVGIVAALIPAGEVAWAIKLHTERANIDEHLPAFLTVVKTFQLENERVPSWERPEGWQETREGLSEFTHAMLSHGEGEEQVKITISVTIAKGAYRVSNFTRWRAQVGLPPPTTQEIASLLHLYLPPSPQRPCCLMAMNYPLAKDDSQVVAALGNPISRTPQPPPRQPRQSITYATPSGWEELAASGMRKAAFRVVDGDEQISITITNLLRSGHQLHPNVDRWRGQVSLPPISEEAWPEAEAAIASIESAGRTCEYVQLTGFAPGDESPDAKPIALSVVIVLEGDKAWYIKLHGSAALAAREKEHFEALVSSFQFENSSD